MNHPWMSQHILEIFAEAQHRGRRREYFGPSGGFSRTRDHAKEYEARTRNWAAEAKRKRELAPPRVTLLPFIPSCLVNVKPCPLCGGALEHREGFPPDRWVHVGICSR